MELNLNGYRGNAEFIRGSYGGWGYRCMNYAIKDRRVKYDEMNRIFKMFEKSGLLQKSTRGIKKGDLVTYYGDCGGGDEFIHYGIVEEVRNAKEVFIKSKWGGGDVFLHKLEDSPYTEDTYEVYFLKSKYKPMLKNLVNAGVFR